MRRGPAPGKESRPPIRVRPSTAAGSGEPQRIAADSGVSRFGSRVVTLAHGVCLGWFNGLVRHPFWTVVSVGALVVLPGYVAGPVFYVGLGLALAGWREARAYDRAERRLIRERLGLADPRPARRGRHAVTGPDDDADADRYADAFDRSDDRANVRRAVNAGRSLVRGSVSGGGDAGPGSAAAVVLRSPDRLVG